MPLLEVVFLFHLLRFQTWLLWMEWQLILGIWRWGHWNGVSPTHTYVDSGTYNLKLGSLPMEDVQNH
jgi:hypothetical protein